MTTLVFRYVMRLVGGGLLLAICIIMSMVLLVDFVELTRTLGSRSDASPARILGLALLRAPTMIETTLPFIFLFGVMWGMFRLNRTGELVAMRAAGVSAWRFVSPAVVIAVAVGVFATAVLNPAAARLNAAFERQRAALSDSFSQNFDLSDTGLWLREAGESGQTVINAKQAQDGGRALNDVTVYIYADAADGPPAFDRRIDAASAVMRTGFWQLSDAWETRPEAAPVRHETIALPTELNAGRLVESFGAATSRSFWELRGQARLLREAGFAASEYELRWHRLLATPLTLAAMSILAAAVSLRLARRGGAFQLAMAGAILGFGLFFAENLLAALGSTGVLDTASAAWSAPAFALAGGLSALAWMEDG